MSFKDDSELIKAKLNLHVKKRLKESPQNPPKRKVDYPTTPEDTEPPTPSPKKQKTKKAKPKKLPADDEEEESNSEDRAADASDAGPDGGTQKVSTLDVLQVLLNQKKVSLLRDESVIEFIQKKQSRLH